MTRILGIDPGIRGGLAIVAFNDGAAPQLIDAIDVPTVGSGAKERVNVLFIQEWLLQHGPASAFIERGQALPRQGASSGFKYGRSVGSLETTITLCGIALEIVEPSMWKRFFRLPGKDKEAARQRAIALFPAAHRFFARRKDHQRGEAALIALYGLRTLQPVTKTHDETPAASDPVVEDAL
jgi:crossover junction endodeoxyribonuclease RuvC